MQASPKPRPPSGEQPPQPAGGASRISLPLRGRHLALGAALLATLPGLWYWLGPADGDSQRRDSSGSDSAGLAAAGYVDPTACAGCHAAIWESFRNSGMGRSFAALSPAIEVADWHDDNTFRHGLSNRFYKMYRRAGSYFMRRWQEGFDGQEENIVELRVDYALGSGLKARSYLSRTAAGELVQLPVGWYSEQGGFWAMSPGYDRPDHDGFRRRVQFDCMFCHNAYPNIAPGADKFDADRIVYGELPEGIDCQRCHGPGREHIDSLAAGVSPEAVASSIANPARMSPERQLEVCLQCHLQSTSRQLPYAVGRAGRGVFSYRPGQPLGDYTIHFDHEPGSAFDGKFEIAHAAYRLLQSECYRQAGQDLNCTTCHDPHTTLHAGDVPATSNAACQSCHLHRLRTLSSSSSHPADGDCARCHMPQRRTDDVVHVVMTDHRIQRPRSGDDLLATKPEVPDPPYQGDVVPLYPALLPRNSRDELDIAVAQVKAGSNLVRGLAELEGLVTSLSPPSPRYSFELAEALRRAGRPEQALRWYERTLDVAPEFFPALQSYGMALADTGQAGEATEALRAALRLVPESPRTLHNLSLVQFQTGRIHDAIRNLRDSIVLEPDSPATHNALASALYQAGDPNGAEEAFREAIRLQPDYTLARANLARLLQATGRLREAAYHRAHAETRTNGGAR